MTDSETPRSNTPHSKDPEARRPSAPAHLGGPDPELEALPEPRRPGRTATLVVMSVTALASVAMLAAVLGEALYAVRGGSPTDLGELTAFSPNAERTNTFVRGGASLGNQGAIRYARPLETDSFRLAPVDGNPSVWVEIRVPREQESERFVPPASFVGRLVPFTRAGLRHVGLPEEVKAVTGAAVPEHAWLLVDGETPPSVSWALGLVGLFTGFLAFNTFGLVRLLRPIRDR
jgi:hypothetical protein